MDVVVHVCMYVCIVAILAQLASIWRPNCFCKRQTSCKCYSVCLMSEPSENSSAKVPIFEVAFKSDMWWTIPATTSKQIYEQYVNNQHAGYTWDWGMEAPHGEETTTNHYIIDFKTWVQQNLDNDRRRSVRLVWVAPERVDPIWAGEFPDKRPRKG